MANHNTQRPIFALVDGNAFYASCQIVFNPSLATRPVVVLSNNDGCIVAANQIAKDLNQELLAKLGDLGSGGNRAAHPKSMMFQPYFKVKWLLDKHRAAVFSSNYELYADMSNRMHRLLAEMAPKQEIYSIDESFLDLSGLQTSYNLSEYGQLIKTRVQQELGLPVAVGIGHSKTLAKLANHLAKKQPQNHGVLDLTVLDKHALEALLAQVDINNLWGIGKNLALKLRADGIQTALALRQANPKILRKKYTVVMERIIQELNGESCLPLESLASAKKQLISSRSFGQPQSDYHSVEQAVVSHTLNAAHKLRRQNSVCQILHLYLRTNPFSDTAQYHPHHQIGLVYPSDNSILLSKLARRALRSIWRDGFAYHKVGVMLSEITPKGAFQQDLFAQSPKYSANPQQEKLMQTLDQINQTQGRNTLFFAAQGIPQKNAWQMKRLRMSPRYTTRWDEILTVR
ncbi:protein UmuC [Thiosulfatimonas sediminis]|uniref:Protein UmuC n=1 Tax=Thiosulfatimonas sediminis TaxID=2675054 RepID=A0A6F8PVN6_9GAMM|nr:Y-family DNA polymerase [Thiosulfatimonas sediminis]BBP46203.1 protein UmuC [Thiosulfatimonas sediminis]